MTGRKIPELVFMGVCLGGSANPTTLQIYRWNGKTFRQVLEAGSGEMPLWIEDLRHTGRYQVRCVEALGSSDMSHGDRVRWADIFDWIGREYIEANANYPEAFQETKMQLLERLKDYPNDPDLLKHLGMVYLYEHRPRSACAVFRKLIQADPPDYDGWWDLGEIAKSRGRLRQAVNCFRHVRSLCLKHGSKTSATSIAPRPPILGEIRRRVLVSSPGIGAEGAKTGFLYTL
jgi:tetratricopeptide (TPR) repeat protein